MNRNNQPVAIVPNVEDDKTANLIGIGETGPQLLKVSPPSLLRDPAPGADLASSLPIILSGLLQALDGDDVH
jgi:hypothetical protein